MYTGITVCKDLSFYVYIFHLILYTEFGDGIKHTNADAMIGDYVAIAISDLTVFNTREEAEKMIGVHAGYTKEELTIPFIVYEA